MNTFIREPVGQRPRGRSSRGPSRAPLAAATALMLGAALITMSVPAMSPPAAASTGQAPCTPGGPGGMRLRLHADNAFALAVNIPGTGLCLLVNSDGHQRATWDVVQGPHWAQGELDVGPRLGHDRGWTRIKTVVPTASGGMTAAWRTVRAGTTQDSGTATWDGTGGVTFTSQQANGQVTAGRGAGNQFSDQVTSSSGTQTAGSATVTKNPDGSTTRTQTQANPDGGQSTSSVTMAADRSWYDASCHVTYGNDTIRDQSRHAEDNGSGIRTYTDDDNVTYPDGSTGTSRTVTTENQNTGESSEVETDSHRDADGNVTRTYSRSSTRDAQGNTTTTEIETSTDAKGNTTTTTTKSTRDASGNSTSTQTVTDGSGNVIQHSSSDDVGTSGTSVSYTDPATGTTFSGSVTQDSAGNTVETSTETDSKGTIISQIVITTGSEGSSNVFHMSDDDGTIVTGSTTQDSSDGTMTVTDTTTDQEGNVTSDTTTSDNPSPTEGSAGGTDGNGAGNGDGSGDPAGGGDDGIGSGTGGSLPAYDDNYGTPPGPKGHVGQDNRVFQHDQGADDWDEGAQRNASIDAQLAASIGPAADLGWDGTGADDYRAPVNLDASFTQPAGAIEDWSSFASPRVFTALAASLGTLSAAAPAAASLRAMAGAMQG